MAKKSSKNIDIASAAKDLLGFRSLRPGQEEAIRSLLDGHDTVVVQPTGSGKSAIYQIAGDLIRGTTVVISPLIALQKDQVDSINEKDMQEAAVVNSMLAAGEKRQTLKRIEEGEIQYIFLAPEQLRKRESIDRLRAAGVSLFVVDEAHCVSQWGHDFRPDYLQLSVAIEALGHPPTLAMTATASTEVRQEIAERLGLRSPKVFVHGFDRPNISLAVETLPTREEKREALLKRIKSANKPGLVYVGSHASAQSIASQLQERHIDAVYYHGGMKAKERDAIQDRFMTGDAPVIVATNAFGMGVDKADVRFVYHEDPSPSLDAYYQEIGRAGRDGKPAEAVLFFEQRNLVPHKSSFGKIDTTQLEHVAAALTEQDGPVSPEVLSEDLDLSARKLINTVHKLEEVGAAEQLPSGEIQSATDQGPTEIAELSTEQQHEQQKLRREKLEKVQEYIDLETCRREYLLRYFGDDYTGPCGNCDNCVKKRNG